MKIKRLHQKNFSCGFTLIEVLLYSFILAIILGSLVITGFSMLSSSSILENRSEIFESGKIITNKIKWALTGATDISSPAPGSSSSVLSIENNFVSPATLTFDLSDDVLRLTTGNQSPIPITGNLVKISNLNFTRYSYSNQTKDTIRVQALIASANPGITSSLSLDFYISTQ